MTAPLEVYVAGSSRDLERAERVIACIFDALIPPEHVVDTDDEAVAIVQRIADAMRGAR